MNKKIILYCLALVCCFSFVRCEDDNIDYGQESEEQGALAVYVTKSGSATQDDDDLTLRIYNTSDRLVARYSNDEIPEIIYLAEGNYKATVFVGEQVEMSYSTDDISYYGEQEFSIEGSKVSSLDINCTMQNTVVEVVFDQSVYDRFELEAEVYLCLSNSFSKEDALDGSVPTLYFDSDGYGYFILPDDVDNISWGFYGSSASIDPTTVIPSTTAEFSGVIENPLSATKYTLSFVYSMTPDGYMGLTVSVDESVDEYYDPFGFAPQPTISGQDFKMSDEGLMFSGEDRLFDISAINDLSSIVISSDQMEGGSLTVMEDGLVGNISGVSYSATDSKSGVLTLSHEFFSLFSSYGSKEIEIAATDTASSRGHESMNILVSGLDKTSFDPWSSTASFSAQVLIENASDVKIAYKLSDSQTWSELSAVKGSGYNYTAAIEPTWTTSKNDAGLTVYSIDGGILTGVKYEYRLIVDGIEYSLASQTIASGNQIPNADMEDDTIKAFDTSASSSTDWASGNNSFASDLCIQVSKGGSYCAYLKSKLATVAFAAGNINFGQFAFTWTTTSGTMRFGQTFDWTARPRSFKFRYAATLGKVDYNPKDIFDDNGTDKARVFFAVVDWSDRHAVTAGTSGVTDGSSWDPASQTSVTVGNIIGYASLFIEESTEGDGLHEQELTIYYYDKESKPSANNISIVVSCAASAYGDYMTGSTDSRLWVDDFELVY